MTSSNYLCISVFQVFKAQITQNQNNQIFTLVNEPWDGDLEDGTIFDLDFIVRYPENTSPPLLVAASINGVPIDIGQSTCSTTCNKLKAGLRYKSN